MFDRLFRDMPVAALLTGAGWLGLAIAPVQADGPLGHRPQWMCPPQSSPPCVTPQYQPMPQALPSTPQAQVPAQPSQTAPAPAPLAPQAPMLGTELASAVGGEDVAIAAGNVGYIDSAIIRSQVRLRFDSAADNNRPDRAEFFYPKCGCFGTPDAKGPRLPERSVDYQEFTTYVEYAFSNRFSAFVEVPYRFLNPENNAKESGLGDIQLGARFGLFTHQDMAVTFQLKLFLPTGDGAEGLGTEHYSLEPGLLMYQRLGDRLSLEAEVRDWISLDGSDFSGNVLRYGVGVGYDVIQSCNLRVTPVAELVAWTVIDGKSFELQRNQVFDEDGSTIVNGKLGVRATMGTSSFYVGYGRALTGDVWYKDVVRLEYRLSF